MLIQITNLHLNVIETDIQRLLTPYGEVDTIEILRDKINNRSMGKAFADMPVKNEAQNAIISLHGTLVLGKSIVVTEAASS